jgi:hypothetical protein
MWIKILLILAVLGLLLFFLRNHGTSRSGATVKIAFALFVVFGIVTVLAPNLSSELAGLVGVGRGADLVLYMLVVAFGFATINTYLRFKELELRYARLARAVALRGAEPPADPEK